MEFIREHKTGIIGTIVFHAIVIILLLFLGFFTPLPLPEEQGILVNFGTDDNGLGELEPAPSKEPAPQQETVKEQKIAPVQPKQTKVAPPPKDDGVATQDFEEAAAMKKAEQKKKKEIEEQKRIQTEQERIRLAELERKRMEEAEKRRAEEAERKRKEEEQRKISEINSRTKGAFGSGGAGTGGAGTSNESTGQGATFPGGNQGSPNGDPNAGNFGDGGKGNGAAGTGTSFNLAGRSARSLPKPNYPDDDEGVVVVKVTVDKNGNVTAAEPGARGTTIMNQSFWAEAKSAALKAKFNVDNNAPAFQQGTITYKFTLD